MALQVVQTEGKFPTKSQKFQYICPVKLIIVIFLLVFASGSTGAQSKKKFSRQDSLKLSFCHCDSIYKNWTPKPSSKVDAPEYEGNGWNRLYNFQDKLGQCGYFEKYYFIYGLRYKYDENGNLKQIQKYHNGKLIGNCEIKKK